MKSTHVSMSNIVVIDDNLVIRHVIKRYIDTFSPVGEHLGFYSSDNGVEGLGYILATETSLIVLDLTLPKFSGREVLDSLVSNSGVKQSKTPIILLHENFEQPNDLPEHIVLLNKQDEDFLEQLIHHLDHHFCLHKKYTGKHVYNSSLIKRTATRTIGLANRSDIVMARAVASNFLKRISLYAYWFFLDLAIGANLFIFNFYTKPTFDINIKQAKSDLLKYRVKYYGSLTATITTVGILAIELMLLLVGGVMIFGVKVRSFFG